MEQDPRQQLNSLVSAIRAHLSWRRQHGLEWVTNSPSPRSGKLAVAPAGEETPDEQPGQAAPSPEPPAQPAPAEPLAGDLEQLREELGDCQRCRLYRGRKTIVFGQGSPDADLMFIGEAPGREEDLRGEAFVGAAGQLLTRMLKAMGLEREEVYIANIIKCRPPRNRDPAPDEISACEVFLRRQIDAIGPSMIITLGAFAAKTLLDTDTGITRLRGRFATYHGVPLMPTFHPAYLLRNPKAKRPAWDDLKMVMARMDQLGLKRRR